MVLGQYRTEISAFGMVGWLNYSEDELISQCRRAIDNGYCAVQMKVGAPNLAEYLRRIEVVRNTLGPNVRLMLDANKIHSVDEAVRRADAYVPYDIYWYE